MQLVVAHIVDVLFLNYSTNQYFSGLNLAQVWLDLYYNYILPSIADIDDCALTENPCGDHGACIDGDNDFSCQCEGGFSGEDCSVSKCHYEIYISQMIIQSVDYIYKQYVLYKSIGIRTSLIIVEHLIVQSLISEIKWLVVKCWRRGYES